MPKPRPWTPEYRQEAPYCLQIESTIGCNLLCGVCGLNGIADPNKTRFMTLETAEVIARRIAESGWNPRLELARRGEPSLHPEIVEVVALLRRYNPRLQIQMTTNAGGLLRKPGAVPRVAALFDAGLNVLAIDDYDAMRLGEKIREALGCELPRSSDVVPNPNLRHVLWKEYPVDPESHPNHRYKLTQPRVVFLEDLEKSAASRANVNNHAGFGGPLRDYPKPCAKPFREIGINYDGSIDLCCISWLGEFRIGNLYERSLKDIWLDPKFEAARRYLIRGQRSALRPCAGCDHGTYNLNWLPGKGGDGRVGYPEPTEIDASIVRSALERGPVERPSARAMTNVYPSLPLEQKAAWDRRLATTEGER